MNEDYYRCKKGHQWFCRWPESMPVEDRVDCCPACLEHGLDSDGPIYTGWAIYLPTTLDPEIHAAMFESMTVAVWH